MALAGLVLGTVLMLNGHSDGVFLVSASTFATIGVTASVSRQKSGRSSL
jgi:hypothetical protein